MNRRQRRAIGSRRMQIRRLLRSWRFELTTVVPICQHGLSLETIEWLEQSARFELPGLISVRDCNGPAQAS